MLEDHVRPSVKDNPPKTAWKLKNALCYLFIYFLLSLHDPWPRPNPNQHFSMNPAWLWRVKSNPWNNFSFVKILLPFCSKPYIWSKSTQREKTGGRDKPIIHQRHKVRAYKGQVLSYYWSGQEPWREQTPAALHHADSRLPCTHFSFQRKVLLLSYTNFLFPFLIYN